MFEPGLTKGMLEVFVAPSHHLHCSTDDQSTKAIDIQNAYLNGTSHLPKGKELKFLLDRASSDSPKGASHINESPVLTTFRVMQD